MKNYYINIENTHIMVGPYKVPLKIVKEGKESVKQYIIKLKEKRK